MTTKSTMFAALLAAAVAAGCGGESGPEGSGPVNAGVNVLLITVDTLRADHLSTYGYARATSPNVDALAAKGVVFDRAYTYWPKTRGSFASMFTGLYASQHGLTVRDRDLPEFNRTLAETLYDAGYRTAAALDNGNLASLNGFAQGFETYRETFVEHGADSALELERTESITSFGEQYLSEPGDGRPFFLWLHYVNPHTPYTPPEEALAQFRGDGLVPRGPELEPVTGYQGGVNRKHVAVEGETYWGDYIDRYDAEILTADQHVGRVLDALEKSDHAASTLIVLTSDHGESLGEHNYYFDHGLDVFDPSLRIPFVLSFPGMLPQGERVQGAVTTLDLFPTVLDLAQVSYPPDLQGSSVLPLVRGTTDEIHDQVYFQNDRHLLAISNGRLKLIRHPDDGHQLFDTYRDPNELEDRYAESRSRIAPFEAQLSSFRTQTVAWQQATTTKRQGPTEQAPPIDPEQLKASCESLVALGYIDSPADCDMGNEETGEEDSR